MAVSTAAAAPSTRTVQPGGQIVETQRLFAGAKRNEILSAYEKSLNLPRFIYAIDWGFLFFLTRPISATLLALAAIAIVVAILPSVRKKRDEVFVEED